MEGMENTPNLLTFNIPALGYKMENTTTILLKFKVLENQIKYT